MAAAAGPERGIVQVNQAGANSPNLAPGRTELYLKAFRPPGMSSLVRGHGT